MKPTDKNIAKFVGYTKKTISTYKNSDKPEYRRRYIAFVKLFREYYKIEDLD